eukprot:1157956-Pelagomonas_calceolata.AAC.14
MRAELLAGLTGMREALDHGTPSTQPPLSPPARHQDQLHQPMMEQPALPSSVSSTKCVASAVDKQGVLVAGGDDGVVQDRTAPSGIAQGGADSASLDAGQGHPSAAAPADVSSGGSASADGVANGVGAGGEASSSAVRAPQRWRGFSALTGELVVGGVFVRVYNSKPAALPADAPGFCKALVRWSAKLLQDTSCYNN